MHRVIPSILSGVALYSSAVSAIEFNVGGCVITHNGNLADSDVRQIVGSHLGDDATIEQCASEASAIEVDVRKSGAFAARVFTVYSEDKSRVQLNIVEGKLAEGGIVLSTSLERVSDATILKQLSSTLKEGSYLTAADYERAILLTNDIPGVKGSSSRLLPADKVGEAKFELAASEAKLIEGNVYADNFGSVYTGENRLGVTIDVNSPFHVGDKFSVGANMSDEGTWFVYVDGSVPVFSNGMRAGITFDALDYQADEAGDLRGSSNLAEVYLHHPIMRSRKTNVYAELRLGQKSLKDETDTGVVTDRVVQTGKLKLSGDHIDAYFGGATNSFELQAVLGNLDLDGYEPYKQEDAATAKTAGNFSLMTWQFARLQHVYGPWQSQLEIAGQIASKRLDGSQSIAFGGPFDFPGYHSGEILGDEGARLHWDIRYNAALESIGGEQQVSLFYNIGRQKSHAKEIVGGLIVPGIEDVYYTMQSAGIGFSQIWSVISIKGALGWRIDNEIPEEFLDGDSDDDFNAWVQLVYSY